MVTIMLNKGNSKNKFLKRFQVDENGGITVFVGFFSVLALGVGALVLDVGRMSVMRSQMQNRADSAVMAGASQLDGRPGAQARATALAVDAINLTSAMTFSGANLSIQGVAFYSELEPVPVLATSDEDSQFIQVILEPKDVRYLFQPLLVTASSTTETFNAASMATSEPFICHAPPLMICDPEEFDSALDLSLEANIGRQIPLKPPPSGGSAWAPGNYGLLALPDGSIGASDIEMALAAVLPEDCYDLDVGTAPGVKTNKVENGMNARFDIPGGLSNPAPNVINYPKDDNIDVDSDLSMGSGVWGVSDYWNARHATPLPSDLLAASRYQVYLYELGLEYARKGRATLYPIEGALPTGYVVVTPSTADVPENLTYPDDPDFDGVPSQSIASNGYARRLVQVAVLQCQADGVRGSHEYPTNGNYLEMFITEAIDDAPAGGIYAEIVRTLTPSTSPDFHSNVKLVQ